MNSNAGEMTAAVERGSSASRRLWTSITSLIAVMAFLEPVFAGAMLSGIDGARIAHAAGAAVLVASTLISGAVAIVTLFRAPDGGKLSRILFVLAAAVFTQAVVGVMASKGAPLLWLHIPLGVAVFGFATRAAGLARAL
jgi:hypothetical protein